MKIVTFYLLDQHVIKHGLITMERLACNLAILHWRAGKRVLIACENNEQARKLDNALWTQTTAAFIPHNLVGEGPQDGAPIEISWPHRRCNVPRDLIISLIPTCTDFAFSCHEVIDFVPNEEYLKQLARKRYKAYRSVGFQLITAQPPP
ncbi:DNA polymerase III subunit chi [Candidatus Palibaumannia cicadellinicola]|uniref:DNA polymerase III subunit chi n=1 Tax=Candidatus Palibaumannia cicadellinicola TaxID=186490 RepID=A0A2N4XXE7_9GAMM|nr:DNA polymerase III subunit chi [Candidatus Baumannia cicadellinicola]PLK59106.1 DNA polymerase III subunit chi [Candidatus Baumannia cicadellinicola]